MKMQYNMNEVPLLRITSPKLQNKPMFSLISIVFSCANTQGLVLFCQVLRYLLLRFLPPP